MARAVSTVLDVSVCLLLIGAAASTLVLAVPEERDPSEPNADTVANSLGTTTAAVEVAGDRRSHGTFAEHLSRAALESGSIGGDRLLASTYPDTVDRAVRNHTDERAYVTARWEPYPNASLRGRIAVGSAPPATADVSTTRRTVDSGIVEPDAAGGFDSLAASLSAAYIEHLFPPERTRAELLDPRTARRTADRYRVIAAVLGVTVGSELAAADTRAANERLARALGDRVESDLEAGYPSVRVARDATAVGSIELVVRRWDA